MNIALPKPENLIVALGQVGIASLVALLVRRLNFIQCCEFGRVAVPEIAIPLDNQSSGGNQCIHDELTADYLLLHELKIKRGQNLFPCLLKFRWHALRDGIKHFLKMSVRCVGAVVTASVGAVPGRASIKSPSGHVDRLGAGTASNYLAPASNAKRSLPALFFSFRRVLPSIRAIKRAKANCPFAKGEELFAAPKACVGAAIVTSFCDVRARGKVAAAQYASLTQSVISHWLDYTLVGS